MDNVSQEGDDPQTHLLVRLMPDLPRRPPDDARGIIYHYTNQPGIIGILDSENIWCTDIRFLNDSRELVHTLDFAKSLLEAKANKTTEVRAKLYREWVSQLWLLKDYPIYVASFSEEDDLLSQWRAYCNPTGFAVGFVALDLMNLAEAFTLPGILLKCIYDVRTQQDHLEYAMEYLADYFENNGATPDASNTASRLFFSFLLTAAACFKNPGFEEEKEWRLVLRAFAGATKGVMKKFRPGAGTIVPYIEFPLTPDGGHLPIRIIVAGPSPSLSVHSDALGELIAASNLAGDMMRGASIIPFRPS